jgi:Zn-dependent protease/predicted transcriptional regulator
MRYSFRIATVWGVPIELHITFVLLIAAVAVLSYPSFYLFALIVFLFVFVALHELAHTLVAKHYKIRVRKIVLYPIGGVSEIEEIPQIPSVEWRLAIAGPLTSLLIGAVLLGVNAALGAAAPQTAVSASLGNASSLLPDLAYLNLFLGGFNLIPAFPMDGGRVLRALLAQRFKFADATKYAVYLGRVLGVGMVVFGFVFPAYILLIFIGLFVYLGAGAEGEQTRILAALAQVKVSEVACAEIGSVKPQNTIAEAMEVMSQSRRHEAIVETDGIYEGLVVWADLAKVKPEQRNMMTIEQAPFKKVSIQRNESVLEAQKIMTKEKLEILPVVDAETPEKVVCVLTSEGLSAAYNRVKGMP